MAETWLPWCQKRPGDRSRTGYTLKSTRSLAEIRYQVNHSAEGWEAYLRAGSAPGASWTFSNLQGGKMYQHYPLELPTWTSGGRRQNIDGLAVEHEGMAGQPLNAAQVANDRRLYADLKRLCPNLRAPVFMQGFREHGELTNGYTACPSGRIQPLYDSYKVVVPPPPDKEWDEMVTEAELTKIVTKIVKDNTASLVPLFKYDGLPGWVFSYDSSRGVLVHELNPATFLAEGQQWGDIVELKEGNGNDEEIMGVPLLLPKGLKHLAHRLKSHPPLI